MGIDLLTRYWWRLVGRPVDLAGSEAWLTAPMTGSGKVRDSWLTQAAEQFGGTVTEGVDGSGLMDLTALDGSDFDAEALQPQIRDFYAHTSAWRMEVWAGWSPLFWPGGELISRFFGQRVEQLALPTRPLDVARGMDSRISVITDSNGQQAAAGWMRTLRSTGEYVFSGCYSHRTLPGATQPSVHVAFPLEEGNVQVFLRPSVQPDGSLMLRSLGGEFGQDGAYVVVRIGGKTHAARVPLHEQFHVFTDDDGVLRTDHVLRLWSAKVVQLHYKLEPLA